MEAIDYSRCCDEVLKEMIECTDLALEALAGQIKKTEVFTQVVALSDLQRQLKMCRMNIQREIDRRLPRLSRFRRRIQNVFRARDNADEDLTVHIINLNADRRGRMRTRINSIRERLSEMFYIFD